MECIILAGGLGTRLRSAIGEQPKCMAPVNDKPFLHYVLEYLQQQACTRAILSLGHRSEVIIEWLKDHQHRFEVDYVIENEPLGTGGGIRLAMDAAIEDHVVVLNGDTMFKVDLAGLVNFHTDRSAETTLALKQIKQFDRYGSVRLNTEGVITSFEEKQFKEEGLINGGVYVINRQRFTQRHLPLKFSFEKDYLEAFVHDQSFYGMPQDGYFIDIGIPSDYQQAQDDFKQVFS